GSLASSTFWVNRPYLNFRIGGWHQYGGQSGANTVHLESVTGGDVYCTCNAPNTNDLLQKVFVVSDPNLQNQQMRVVPSAPLESSLRGGPC
ncbi:MAG: hypothetical protein AB1505_36760, partial [Candidatus Latescibacterota bacterium]